MNESFGQDRRPLKETKPQRKNLRILVIFLLIIGLVIVIALGAYMVYQTRDIWLDLKSETPKTAPTEIMPEPDTTATPDFQATSTAACETFIMEFPGTPCP